MQKSKLPIKSVTPYPVNPPTRSPSKYIHKGAFSVMTIGTGCPDSIIGRSGPCTLVQYNGHYFLVDFGNGATFRLIEAGIDIGKISNLFVTHMHTDHTDDYIKFMIESWTSGRRETYIYGVSGIKALHTVFSTAFEGDITYRMGKTNTDVGIFSKVHIQELKGNHTFKVTGGVTISTAPTIHAVYNLAYRFDVDGKSIVVSGDTSYCESLIELSKGADILVVDVGKVVSKEYLGHGEFIAPQANNNAQTNLDEKTPQTYFPIEITNRNHGDIEDIAIMAQKANVKKLVLTYYPPFVVDIEATKHVISQYYDGEIIFGQDLLEILP